MKLMAALLICSSLAVAQQLYARALRAEWIKQNKIFSLGQAQPIKIDGAKAAYRNRLVFIGNLKNPIPFGVSFVGFKDTKVTNSIGYSYNGMPKSIPEFNNATGALLGLLTGACLGIDQKTVTAFSEILGKTILAAVNSPTKVFTNQKQIGVFNFYVGNVQLTQTAIIYSVVVSSNGVLGKAGWVEYCNPKQ